MFISDVISQARTLSIVMTLCFISGKRQEETYITASTLKTAKIISKYQRIANSSVVSKQTF